MFLVVNPNKHVHSILITNKFKYNKTWKIPSTEAQDFPCPKAVSDSEKKRKSRAVLVCKHVRGAVKDLLGERLISK